MILEALALAFYLGGAVGIFARLRDDGETLTFALFGAGAWPFFYGVKLGVDTYRGPTNSIFGPGGKVE